MKAYSKSVLPCNSCCCRKAAFLTFSYSATWTAKSSGRWSNLKDRRRDMVKPAGYGKIQTKPAVLDELILESPYLTSAD